MWYDEEEEEVHEEVGKEQVRLKEDVFYKEGEEEEERIRRERGTS